VVAVFIADVVVAGSSLIAGVDVAESGGAIEGASMMTILVVVELRLVWSWALATNLVELLNFLG